MHFKRISLWVWEKFLTNFRSIYTWIWHFFTEIFIFTPKFSTFSLLHVSSPAPAPISLNHSSRSIDSSPSSLICNLQFTLFTAFHSSFLQHSSSLEPPPSTVKPSPIQFIFGQEQQQPKRKKYRQHQRIYKSLRRLNEKRSKGIYLVNSQEDCASEHRFESHIYIRNHHDLWLRDEIWDRTCIHSVKAMKRFRISKCRFTRWYAGVVRICGIEVRWNSCVAERSALT